MKNAGIFLVAAGLFVSSAAAAQAQGPELGKDSNKVRTVAPAVKPTSLVVGGKITAIEADTKIIRVDVSAIPAHPGHNLMMEYHAKNATELGKFHEGDMVKGKVSSKADDPPQLATLESYKPVPANAKPAKPQPGPQH
jgi:hypothetical protein